MFAIMIKCVLNLAAATIAVGAVLPNPGLNSSHAITTPPKEGGGFVSHCCKFFFLSFCLQSNITGSSRYSTLDSPIRQTEKMMANKKPPDTHNVGERGELIGRLSGQCGDDTLFENLHYTWIDLNWCLGNDKGQLTWQDG
jgi:hypothetical protein